VCVCVCVRACVGGILPKNTWPCCLLRAEGSSCCHYLPARAIPTPTRTHICKRTRTHMHQLQALTDKMALTPLDASGALPLQLLNRGSTPSKQEAITLWGPDHMVRVIRVCSLWVLQVCECGCVCKCASVLNTWSVRIIRVSVCNT